MNNDHITVTYRSETDNNDNYYFQVYRLEDDGFKIKNNDTPYIQIIEMQTQRQVWVHMTTRIDTHCTLSHARAR